MQGTSYAQELEALKTELRHTLARWERPVAPNGVSGSVFSTPRDQNRGNGSAASQSPPRTATSTPATWSSSSTRTIPSSADRAARPERPLSALSVQQMMQELEQAAQRRRELEQQLAKEMKQDEARRQGELRHRQRQQRSIWQDAIIALQRQRKEILRQIEQETEASQQSSPPDSPPKPASQAAMDSFALPLRTPTSDPSSASIIAANHALRGRVSQQPTTEGKDQQYTIEGVVTLEPMASTHIQQQRPSIPRSVIYGAPQSNQVAVPPMPTKMHDTLNEVFSIQLQFAETMLKLEKSVQLREQLLNHHRSGQGRHQSRSGARRRPRPRTHADNSRRYLAGVVEHPEQDSESNSDLDYLSSSSASLDASLIRARHPDISAGYNNQSRILAPTTPPSSSTASSPPHTGSSSATTTGSSHAGPSPEDNATNKTPSKKLTHADAKKEAELDPATKQVRFEYSTPVIAKKFTFENQSDDEESILSFLEGSSVSSSELSDPSFVRAFEKFRSDLQTAKSFLYAAAAAPGSPPLATARTLFTCDEDVDDDDEDDEDDEEEEVKKNEDPPAAPVKTRGTPAWKQQQASRLASSANVTVSDAAENAPQQSEPELLDTTELMERRRQLCLDIQAESAHLLLSFGSTNAPQRERIKSTLIALRAQLQTVDMHLSQFNT